MRAARRAAAPLGGVLTAMVLLWQARGLDEVARGDQLGPGFWPRLALIGLGVTCLVKLVAEWRRRHAVASPTGRVPRPSGVDPLPEISQAKLAAGVALIVLYVLATPLLGWALATAGFIVAFMWLSGARSIAGIAVNAGVGTVLLLYVFIKLVYLPLPKGAGPVEAVTLALYRALRIF
ncbi:MAG: tripartite tricarboxylate transporter TctB family protein [Candidatus Rokubacteria bacterium]|nr:tripartite tricarboxylate transporter TctB family protein [Candidatus Rokubacteria bacterium]